MMYVIEQVDIQNINSVVSYGRIHGSAQIGTVLIICSKTVIRNQSFAELVMQDTNFFPATKLLLVCVAFFLFMSKESDKWYVFVLCCIRYLWKAFQNKTKNEIWYFWLCKYDIFVCTTQYSKLKSFSQIHKFYL